MKKENSISFACDQQKAPNRLQIVKDKSIPKQMHVNLATLQQFRNEMSDECC